MEKQPGGGTGTEQMVARMHVLCVCCFVALLVGLPSVIRCTQSPQRKGEVSDSSCLFYMLLCGCFRVAKLLIYCVTLVQVSPFLRTMPNEQYRIIINCLRKIFIHIAS